MTILIATSKQWFFDCEKTQEFSDLDTKWVSNPEELSDLLLAGVKPDFICFPHWNWKVTKDVYERFLCVVFHVAPLPFGRGGSPIQNLILRGVTEAPVNALIMGSKLDAGDILLQENISLEGKLSDIFSRIAKVVQRQIVLISKGSFKQTPQTGESTIFRRLSEADNQILHNDHTLISTYDRIRMVDAPEYPNAFRVIEGFKLEFYDASLRDAHIEAKVKISKIESNK